MIYTLFYSPGSAAMVVRILLDEIGAKYELIEVPISKTEPRDPAHLAHNPNGWVPALAWDGGSLYEAAAITVYLCDRYPEAGLGPAPSDSTRPLFLQTLVYFSNTVQTAFQQYYYPERFAEHSETHAGTQKQACRRLRDVWQVVDAQIGDNSWVLGSTFSALDIYMHMLTTWLKPQAGHPDLYELPNVARIAAKVANRPSVDHAYTE